MAFQIKDFVSIVASMVNHVRGTTTKITDMQPGSVARTLIEGPAVEIEEAYLQFFTGLKEAIPVAVYQSFRFDKLPSKYARGFVSVSTETPPGEAFTVAAGTVFTTSDGRGYTSTEAVTWEAGAASIRVPVIADAAGLAYNASSGAIVASPAFDDTYSISNEVINSGRDAESDIERASRFADYVASLSRGTTVACLYAVNSTTLTDGAGNITEYVTRTGYVETAGYEKIYVYSSAGIPSAELVAAAQKIIDGYRDDTTGAIVPGYRSGGVRVDVIAMVERAVPYAAQVAMLPGFTLTEAVKQDLFDTYATALTGVAAGDTLYQGELETRLLSVTGVARIVPAVTSNITCGANEALVPGTFTITAL